MIEKKYYTIMDEIYAYQVIQEVEEIKKYDREKNEN
jgi:hypothetical protein